MKVRSTEKEIMDDPGCDPVLLLRTVDQFAAINRIVSRYRRILSRLVLDDMELAPQRSYHMVDIGAGGCDIMLWLLRESRRRGLKLQVTAIDIDPRIINHARMRTADEDGLNVQMLDAFEISNLAPVDYVFANHFFHHLEHEKIVDLLGIIASTVKRTFVLSDLARSYFSYAGFFLLSNLFFRNSFAISDGLQSIRRGFLLDELRMIATNAGLAHRTSILRLPPGRLVLHGTGQEILEELEGTG